MPKLYVMVGIPASGKSTWARRNLPGAVLVSTDAIREELFGDPRVFRGEKKVFALAHERIIQALREGQDVAYDATNTRPDFRRDLLAMLKSEGLNFEAIAIVMQAAPEVAITLQKGRERKVPEKAIRHFYRILVPPQKEEGFSEIRFVPVKPPPTPLGPSLT